MVTMVWVVVELDLRLKPQLRGAITQSTVIESTTEISSLEVNSPRETASTSAHRVPNNLIADYGREKKTYREIVLRSESKEGLRKVRALRHGAHR